MFTQVQGSGSEAVTTCFVLPTDIAYFINTSVAAFRVIAAVWIPHLFGHMPIALLLLVSEERIDGTDNCMSYAAPFLTLSARGHVRHWVVAAHHPVKGHCF